MHATCANPIAEYLASLPSVSEFKDVSAIPEGGLLPERWWHLSMQIAKDAHKLLEDIPSASAGWSFHPLSMEGVNGARLFERGIRDADYEIFLREVRRLDLCDDPLLDSMSLAFFRSPMTPDLLEFGAEEKKRAQDLVIDFQRGLVRFFAATCAKVNRLHWMDTIDIPELGPVRIYLQAVPDQDTISSRDAPFPCHPQEVGRWNLFGMMYSGDSEPLADILSALWDFGSTETTPPLDLPVLSLKGKRTRNIGYLIQSDKGQKLRGGMTFKDWLAEPSGSPTLMEHYVAFLSAPSLSKASLAKINAHYLKMISDPSCASAGNHLQARFWSDRAHCLRDRSRDLSCLPRPGYLFVSDSADTDTCDAQGLADTAGIPVIEEQYERSDIPSSAHPTTPTLREWFGPSILGFSVLTPGTPRRDATFVAADAHEIIATYVGTDDCNGDSFREHAALIEQAALDANSKPDAQDGLTWADPVATTEITNAERQCLAYLELFLRADEIPQVLGYSCGDDGYRLYNADELDMSLRSLISFVTFASASRRSYLTGIVLNVGAYIENDVYEEVYKVAISDGNRRLERNYRAIYDDDGFYAGLYPEAIMPEGVELLGFHITDSDLSHPDVQRSLRVADELFDEVFGEGAD